MVVVILHQVTEKVLSNNMNRLTIEYIMIPIRSCSFIQVMTGTVHIIIGVCSIRESRAVAPR